MPRSSEHLHAKWGPDESKAITCLEDHGWTMVANGLWHRPSDRSESDLGDEEWEALRYLREEWDHDYIPSCDAVH